MPVKVEALRALPELVESVRGVESFRSVVAALKKGSSGTIDGAWGSSCALVTAAVVLEHDAPLLVVLPRISDVEDFAADLASLLPNPPVVFPAWESLPKERTVKDAVFGARLRVLQ